MCTTVYLRKCTCARAHTHTHTPVTKTHALTQIIHTSLYSKTHPHTHKHTKYIHTHTHTHTHTHIYIYNLIILSCHQYRYSWPSLATPPNHSSLPVGPQAYTPYPHRTAVCRFELVALLVFGHVNGSIGIHQLGARPYFSNSVLHVWFV